MYLIVILAISLALIVAVYKFSITPLRVPENTTKDIKIRYLDNWLNGLYSKGKFQGVVLLASSGEVIFGKGYGFSDSSNKEPLSRHSSFNLASVSKQFTAAGIILLRYKGQLSYTDELRKFIPELSFYSDVTIRHLLNHTSGIPDYLNIANDYLDENESVTADKLIRLYSDKKPNLRFKPGDKFQYSNMGYVLLAEIIERISGTSFSDYMHKHIFQPLNMKHTRVFNLLSTEEPEKRVYGFKKQYFLFGKKLLSDLNRFDGVAGDGGIYSSAYDLFIWHKALLSGAFLPIEELSEAYRPGVLNNGKQTGYGFGWFIRDNGAVEHAGGWQGFATYLYRNPTNDQLIVVLDNTGNILRVTSNGVLYNSIPLNLQHFLNRF